MASPQNSVLEELYKYNPSSVVELFQLELSPLQSYYPTISPTVYRFHNGYNENYGTASPNVEWNGAKFTGRPIQMEGVQFSSSGEIPRPTLTVANHDLAFTQLNKAYANLVGAKIRRIRTLVKFLDSANFKTRNLFVNSEAFNTWTQSNANVAANVAVAPNGTLTADKVYESNGTNTSHTVLKPVTGLANNTSVCFSMYLKAGERQYAALLASSKTDTNLSGKTFDLINGTVSSVTRTTGPTVLSSGIQNVGNGWYRCWVTFSTMSGALNPQYYVYIDNDFNPTGVSYAGVSPTNGNTITTGIYAWGAQLEVVSNPTLTPTIYQTTGATLGNPTADPNAKFPDDVYVIDRMSEETPGQITYELAPAWDVEGVQIPRRQVVANVCPWVYKADPCNWAYNGAKTVTYSSGSAGAPAVIAATISGTTMTVTTLTSGTIRARMFLTGGSVVAGTRIVSQLTGTTGGIGTYKVSLSQTATGITGATPVGTNKDVATKSSSLAGRGIRLSVTVTAASASYSTATIVVTAPGANYSAPGEILTIDGTYLGGASGTNDLIVSVSQIITSQYFDQDDRIVLTAAEDRCGKRLTSCKLRFGTRALPFGGFPSAGLYGKPI
jgi:phage-related protein